MMNVMNWLLKFWPVLTLVFAAGASQAYQEFERRKLEDVVIRQSDITTEQKALRDDQIDMKMKIIRMEERQKMMYDQLNNFIKDMRQKNDIEQ